MKRHKKGARIYATMAHAFAAHALYGMPSVREKSKKKTSRYICDADENKEEKREKTGFYII